ncbi:MAG TPA: TIGR03557 family F420-dependent LLM class oxidoreductase [Jiangellaceae bacterium]|jgi:G6PDH family F420-dependent oxidoreductase|nr:TIGR03557 family F420-dependent LLM class oxidoreductase [Jiangellaceae bacterium]
MTRFGYVLSSEEWNPGDLVAQAVMAADAGFESLGISDHFHPWNDEQGSSPFVWSVIGALSREVDLPVATHVTCPTIRIHPAIIAQAAATASLLLGGRFVLGVGSGEALNEQVLGERWPLADERLEMLEEAIEVMRALWSGEVVTHHGHHYTVEHARLYSKPDQPIPVYVSAFGPEAIDLAGRIGDGYVSTAPSSESVAAFDEAGGRGKPKQAGAKVCYGPDRDAAVKTAHRLWPTNGLAGQLSQDLRTPEHFMQATQNVTVEQIGSNLPCGPDLQVHHDAIQAYVDAGFDEVLISQIGPLQEEFFRFAAQELLPSLRDG